MFEFAFKVETLQASLSRSTDSGDRPLANLILQAFSFNFTTAKFDMQVNVALRSLSLSMFDGSRSIPLIVSLDTATDSTTAKNTTDLVQVEYTSVHPNSPEFMTVHEGINQKVNVILSTFIVHAALDPILNLYNFITNTFVAGDATLEEISPTTQTPERQPPPLANLNSGRMRISVDLTKFEGKSASSYVGIV